MAKNVAVKQFDPSKYFLLHDIALWETSLRREAEYQADVHSGKSEVQTMRSVRAEAYVAELDGEEEPRNFVRTLVTLGVRSVFKPESGDQQILYALEATFAVENIVLEAPLEDDFQVFVSKNCTHLAWSFWRQHVYETFKKASLPVPIIPLLSNAQARKKKRIRRILHSNAGEE